jgi:hypothetical protein
METLKNNAIHFVPDFSFTILYVRIQLKISSNKRRFMFQMVQKDPGKEIRETHALCPMRISLAGFEIIAQTGFLCVVISYFESRWTEFAQVFIGDRPSSLLRPTCFALFINEHQQLEFIN